MTAIALTIAGSDSGGGAGIQADLKTFSALGVYGASAITAITAQNTRGVTGIETLSPGIVEAQIEAVLDDLKVDAIKIGMAANAPTIEAIAAALGRFSGELVLDPVMVATSGDRLLEEDAMEALKQSSGRDIGHDVVAWREYVHSTAPQTTPREGPALVERHQDRF